jgi:probable rRNA maturation factor
MAKKQFEDCYSLCYYQEQMEINVFLDDKLNDNLDISWLNYTVKQAFLALGISGDVEMGVVITNPRKVQDLNKTYRGKNVPTDVLAFTMNTEIDKVDGLTFTDPPDGVRHLGEVIINYSQAITQAKEHQHSTKREVAILVIHGILHLVGYDHAKDEPAQQMADMESAILENLGGVLD